MPQAGWLCVFSEEKKTFSECIDCSRSPHHCEFTPEMLVLMGRGGRGRVNPMNPSVTAILATCLRGTVIKDRFDYYSSPRKAWYLLRGNMVHQILEGTMTKDGWKEVYLTREVTLLDGRKAKLGGKVDKIVLDKLLIRDYKTARRLPTKTKNAYERHDLQLNIYRWIWWPIFQAEKLRLQYIDMTGTKQVKVDVMDIDEIEKLIQEKATAYVLAMEGKEIPAGEYDSKNWPCRYCDVADVCKELNKSKED